MHQFISKSENETIAFAEKLATKLDTGVVVVLNGELGSRKN